MSQAQSITQGGGRWEGAVEAPAPAGPSEGFVWYPKAGSAPPWAIPLQPLGGPGPLPLPRDTPGLLGCAATGERLARQAPFGLSLWGFPLWGRRGLGWYGGSRLAEAQIK